MINPCRIINKQSSKIEYLSDGRYIPVIKDRKKGIIFIRDQLSEQPEIYTNDLPNEPYLIPPEDFIFDEDANKLPEIEKKEE